MPEDELAIRSTVASWLDATRRRDIESLLELMTEDALFLVPGHPPMDKAAFEAASRSQSASGMKVDAVSDIREVNVDGEMGYMWSHLTVTVTASQSTEPVTRAGYTLTIFRKVGGRWLLCRDANLLTRF